MELEITHLFSREALARELEKICLKMASLLKLPLVNSQTTQNFYAENIAQEIDFCNLITAKIEVLCNWIKKSRKSSPSQVLSSEQFLDIYISQASLSQSLEFKVCHNLVLLVLALNDIELTPESAKKI